MCLPEFYIIIMLPGFTNGDFPSPSLSSLPFCVGYSPTYTSSSYPNVPFHQSLLSSLRQWRPPRLVHESYDNLEVLCEFVRVFISTFRRRTGR